MILLVGAFPNLAVCNSIDDYRRLCLYPPGCSWASRSARRFHLTLGELVVVASRLPQVQTILAGLRMPCSDCLVRIPGKAGPVHELIVRVPPAFRDFRDQMHAQLAMAGFEVHGGKRPHITLSYGFAAQGPGAVVRDIPWSVDGFSLVWSRRPPEVRFAEHVPKGAYAAEAPAQARLFA